MGNGQTGIRANIEEEGGGKQVRNVGHEGHRRRRAARPRRAVRTARSCWFSSFSSSSCAGYGGDSVGNEGREGKCVIESEDFSGKEQIAIDDERDSFYFQGEKVGDL